MYIMGRGFLWRSGMSARAQIDPSQSIHAQSPQAEQEFPAPRWNLASRVAFRFCFVYFGLYCLATQILGGSFPIPKVDVPDLATLWPMRPAILWAAAHILRITHPLLYFDTGSGDRMFDWVLVFCLLIVATVATVVWSALDRRR